jgi:hypothetical protein
VVENYRHLRKEWLISVTIKFQPIFPTAVIYLALCINRSANGFATVHLPESAKRFYCFWQKDAWILLK